MHAVLMSSTVASYLWLASRNACGRNVTSQTPSASTRSRELKQRITALV
jgi:hypothetical protein